MHKIKLRSNIINYKVTRSDRKSIGIIIDDNKSVIVRASKKITEEKIEEILHQKTNWILTKLEEMDDIKPSPKEKEYMTGEKLMYLGRKYRLKVEESKSAEDVSIKLYQGSFIIKYPSTLKSEEERIKSIREKLILWYKNHAEIKINERITKYKKILDVEPNKIIIKKQNKRWGSCSGNQNLNFNWKIIIAPMSVVDYIVVHELAHLIQPDHSKEFWDTVKAVIKDAEEKKDWLRVNGKQLVL